MRWVLRRSGPVRLEGDAKRSSLSAARYAVHTQAAQATHSKGHARQTGCASRCSQQVDRSSAEREKWPDSYIAERIKRLNSVLPVCSTEPVQAHKQDSGTFCVYVFIFAVLAGRMPLGNTMHYY